MPCAAPAACSPAFGLCSHSAGRGKARRQAREKSMQKKFVTLALQGGGSHGAFTWGVLDRLLEDERIEIEGISGASAGAMNAVVTAHGMAVGGREAARRALADF